MRFFAVKNLGYEMHPAYFTAIAYEHSYRF